MKYLAIVAAALTMSSPGLQQTEPEPLEPTPSPRQLAWQRLEYYAFVHFGPNTFTDREWGEGTESPETFLPTALDCRQWARVAKEAGMKGIILTAKHHDGFCLWPSKQSRHTVAQSRWKQGKGDVVRELSDACKEFGLEFGVYVSPWDRNHPKYGTPEYNDVFVATLTELLTGYGPIFEVWLDGANGEGPNGKRQEYDWPRFIATVRSLQPEAVIFSDAGPDVRWVGNEQGFAGETNWSLLNRDEFVPGTPRYRELTQGHENGSHWVPAECDVSIRPGWFYHPSEDGQVKSVQHLLGIYLLSVGRNANLLLNLPVDRRGLVHENDVGRLRELRKVLDTIFAHDLARGVDVSASNARADGFSPARAVDGDPESFWATTNATRSAWLELRFPSPTPLNTVVLREPIRLGQRVKSFRVQAQVEGQWVLIGLGTTIGNKRIVTTDTVYATALRVGIEDSKACPLLSSVEVYAAPPTAFIDTPDRDFLDSLRVTLSSDDSRAEIRYTLDGAEPTQASPLYRGPFELRESATLKARAFRNGVGSLWPTEATFKKHDAASLKEPIHFARKPDDGLLCEVFEVSLQSLADFKGGQSTRKEVVSTPALGAQTRDEQFALRFSGVFLAPEDGLYAFSLTSDDGSRLWMHDELTVDNDGLHGPATRRAVVGLKAGYHPLRIEYFNGTGGRELKVEVVGPGGKRLGGPENWAH